MKSVLTSLVFFLTMFMILPLSYPAGGDNAWLNNLRNAIQRDGNTFTVGYNPALQYPLDRLCGLKEPPDWRQRATVRLLSVSSDLPSAFDWRDYGIIPPVRDQLNCGSCWAFGSVGPLEANIKWKDNTEADLSEQWLVSCNTDGWSCDGGWWAHDYHINPGAVPEEEFPYVGQDVSCGGPYSHPYKINSWAYIGSQSDVPSEDQIKEAIYTYGPVSAAIYVGNFFQAYTGGIFNRNEVGSVNHAIVLVGWDDNNGQGYWILRNSWGTGWGENGYMRIRYGTSSVGYSANYIVYSAGVPAEIDVQPRSFWPELVPGGKTTRTLTIINSGQGSLNFSVGWVPGEGLGSSGGPDAFGYFWKDSNDPGGPQFDWKEISSLGTPLHLEDEDYALVDLPFIFDFYGQGHDSISVSANGFLTFGDTSQNYFRNRQVPSTAAPNDLIAPFWDDFDPGSFGGGEIYYYHDRALNRFIVEYRNVLHYGDFFAGDPETFEVILYPDGRIVYQYLTVSNPQFDSSGCTVGIENASGTIGLQVAYNRDYPESNLAVEFQRAPLWLSLSPTQGNVAPHGSQAVEVTFDAARLSAGTYRAEIIVTSNDADEGELHLPVTLIVGSYLSNVDSGDFNGDGLDDIALFRPSARVWDIRGVGTYSFGQEGDIPVPADYNGDGKTELAVFRPGRGLWAVYQGQRYYLGRSGDQPAPGDYDGNGTAEATLFRPEAGLWILGSGRKFYFGKKDDQIVPGDFNGDGKKDLALFRPTAHLWAVSGLSRWYFGKSGDLPLVNDFNGDRTEESAIFRPGSGLWAVRNMTRFYFGRSGNTPVALDYNRRAGAEAALFSLPSCRWEVRQLTNFYFGQAEDLPVTR